MNYQSNEEKQWSTFIENYVFHRGDTLCLGQHYLLFCKHSICSQTLILIQFEMVFYVINLKYINSWSRFFIGAQVKINFIWSTSFDQLVLHNFYTWTCLKGNFLFINGKMYLHEQNRPQELLCSIISLYSLRII